MEWGAPDTTEPDVIERPFWAQNGSGRVPGILWSPSAAGGPAPLVLLGHGGSGHKRGDRVLSVALDLVRRYGIAAAAIDGPVHGERGPVVEGALDGPEYVGMWLRPDTFDRMIGDWQAVIEGVTALPEIDGSRIGYRGLSMGTMFGIPLVAAEPRISVAVLGLCGLTGSSAERGRIADRHRADAPRIACPVQFLIQMDDERFDTAGSLALFQLLGTPDKRLQGYPGLHADLPDEGTDSSLAFLAAHLGRTAA